MKAVWQGSISFGLVNIPIKLYSSSRPRELAFRLLCGVCHTPLKYQRYCPSCKKEVIWQNVVRGVELRKGTFHILTTEKLQKLKPLKTETIDIVAFIDPIAIDHLYYSANYYVVPAKSKEKAYWLFREALRATAKAALGRFVMHEKEHTALIRAYRSGMLLTLLHYPYELRSIDELEELREKVEIGKRELELATKLLESMTQEEIDMAKFKDTFVEKLRQVLLGKIEPIKEAKPKPQKLLQALQLSIRRTKKRKNEL